MEESRTFSLFQDYHIHTFLSSCSSDPEQTAERILQYGRENGISRVIADTTADNLASQTVLKRNGFALKEIRDEKLIFILDDDPQ